MYPKVFAAIYLHCFFDSFGPSVFHFGLVFMLGIAPSASDGTMDLAMESRLAMDDGFTSCGLPTPRPHGIWKGD